MYAVYICIYICMCAYMYRECSQNNGNLFIFYFERILFVYIKVIPFKLDHIRYYGIIWAHFSIPVKGKLPFILDYFFFLKIRLWWKVLYNLDDECEYSVTAMKMDNDDKTSYGLLGHDHLLKLPDGHIHIYYRLIGRVNQRVWLGTKTPQVWFLALTRF